MKLLRLWSDFFRASRRPTGSDFGLRASFGFRISVFGFPSRPIPLETAKNQQWSSNRVTPLIQVVISGLKFCLVEEAKASTVVFRRV
jgi:hypothetical protein